MEFINLHQHSHYSKLDSVGKIEDIVKRNKELGSPAVAITEHGTLSSTYELHKECNKQDVKPILGVEAYYVDSYDEEDALTRGFYAHVLLLAKNEKGWQNLKKLQAIAWEEGYLFRPRIDWASLKKYSKGIICTSSCAVGLVGQIYLGYKGKYKEMDTTERELAVYERILKFRKVFGKDFYLEIQVNDYPDYVKLNKFVIKLGKKFKIKVMVSNDVHYVYQSDHDLHDIARCVAFGKSITDENNGTYGTKQLFIRGYDGIDSYRERWHPYISEKKFIKYCMETVKIAKKVKHFPIRPEANSLLKFCKNPNKKLREVCEAGFKKKIANSKQKYYKKLRKSKKRQKEYRKRFEYELKVIKDLGYSDYYLIVMDIVDEARKRKIPFNMRGSVCGSMAAFCCGISWIDPIRFDCPFERFLTEDRLSMPDMDMDFARSRRDEMIQYLSDKYGDECVAHIESFGRYKLKGAIKDVARVMGVDYGLANSVTKLIKDNAVTWKDIPKGNGTIDKFFEDNDYIEDYVNRMLGRIHATGVHASGIILTPEALEKWTPIAYMVDKSSGNKKQVKVTEWDMYALEDLDILKLDFLGLNNLDIVADCLESMNDRHDDLPYNDLDSLYEYVLGHLDDQKVYELCRKGHLVGTFQMGTSEGMRTLIKDIKPDNIDDIIASIALYRSAVLQAGMHTEYIKRKHGEYFDYIHPKMEEILKDTQGVMLYQEQTMSCAVHLAGFTKNESDHFRKGIKLKDPTKIKPWRDKFITGCKKYSDIDKDLADQIWMFIENFAGYGFNKCLHPENTVEDIDGNFKCLAEVEVGDHIKSYDGEKFWYDTVEEIIDQGKQFVYEVFMDNGNVIKCTLDHKFMCEDGKMRSLKNIFAEDLSIVTDEVIIKYD